MADYFPLIVNTANSTIDELPAGDNLNLANSNIVNAANISANGVKTDNLYYANGQPWDLQQPAGSNNELQFNNDGSFGASANLTYNDTTQLFTVSGNIDAVNVDAGNLLTANFVSGTLTTSSQPNITNVGSLVNLDVSGNAVIGGNLTVNGNVTYVNVETLDIEDPIIQLQTGPNGAAPTSNSGKDVGTALNYYDTQARVAFMGWDVSNVEFGLASRASISGEVVTFTEYGNLRAGNIAGSNLVSANYVSGTLTTAAQPNITSVGALTSLVVSGSANSTITVIDSGNVGNIIGLVHLNPVVENYTSLGVNVDGVSVFIANSNTGNTNSAKSYWNFTSGGNLEHILGGAGAVVAKQGVFGTGNITAGNVYANSGTVGAQTLKGEGGNISNIQGANVSGTVSSANTSGTVTTNAQPNITSVGTLSSLSVTGNANVGNIGATTGVFTNVSGNGAQLTAITGANVTGQVSYAAVANSVSVGNVSGIGNIATINLNGNSQQWLAGNGVWANIAIPTVGNIATINITGNSAQVLYGNGVFSALTVSAANVSGLGNVALLNYDGNSSNVLYGNGVFATASGGGGAGATGLQDIFMMMGA